MGGWLGGGWTGRWVDGWMGGLSSEGQKIQT